MRSISYIVLVLLSLPAFAQTTQQAKSHSPRTVWEPPDWNFPQDVKANGQDEMLSSFRISSYEIVHGRTAMKDSQQRLGGHIGSRGSDALEWLCFHGANEMGRGFCGWRTTKLVGLLLALSSGGSSPKAMFLTLVVRHCERRTQRSPYLSPRSRLELRSRRH